MSIEIYSNAETIKKDNKIYYFLKHHSKNDCIYSGQTVIGTDFRNKFLIRDGRGGSWSIKAIGTIATHKDYKILETKWNAPTSWVYGRILFGDKKNISLFWAKHNIKDFYIDFNDDQQKNIDKIIRWTTDAKHTKNFIDLENIEEKEKMKPFTTYCDDKSINIAQHSIIFAGMPVWQLDNL